MIPAIATLLLFQLLGEGLVRLLALPIPGPVAGMALLFVVLIIHGRVPEGLRTTAGGLLQHLSLLFIPAGTGVIVYVGRIAGEAVPIAAALVVGTILPIAATGLAVKGMEWLRARRRAAS
ncbi:MAG TPA: CidA/LrgA family protein [Azospirillaceae bacterium]|nr:CidA/LrgA family protein [Azospirillaceae bacterium]